MASAIMEADLLHCSDPLDLLGLLLYLSVDRMFDESTNGFVDMLSIYRWAAANKVRDALMNFARYLCQITTVTDPLTM